jgi:hypothetical protein
MRLKGGTIRNYDNIDNIAHNRFDNFTALQTDILDTTDEEDIVEEGDIFDTFERHTDDYSGQSALNSNPGIIYDIVSRTGGVDKEKGYFRLPSILSTAYRFFLSSDGWLRCQTPSEGLG